MTLTQIIAINNLQCGGVGSGRKPEWGSTKVVIGKHTELKRLKDLHDVLKNHPYRQGNSDTQDKMDFITNLDSLINRTKKFVAQNPDQNYKYTPEQLQLHHAYLPGEKSKELDSAQNKLNWNDGPKSEFANDDALSEVHSVLTDLNYRAGNKTWDKNQTDVSAGGIGSGRHKELNEVLELHDRIKEHPGRINDNPSQTATEHYHKQLWKLYEGVNKLVPRSGTKSRNAESDIQRAKTALNDIPVAMSKDKDTHGYRRKIILNEEYALSSLHTALGFLYKDAGLPVYGDGKPKEIKSTIGDSSPAFSYVMAPIPGSILKKNQPKQWQPGDGWHKNDSLESKKQARMDLKQIMKRTRRQSQSKPELAQVAVTPVFPGAIG